ncbi:hypothetical protein D3C76_420160 [compost metagenome]
MSNVQLSIPVAMLVENALTSGEPAEVIIDLLQRREFALLQGKVKEQEMDFAERLDTAAELGDPWEEAIRSGYAFKFLHIGGLKRLLDFRFNRKIDRDFVQEGTSLRQLYLSPEEIAVLRPLISRQWEVRAETGSSATGEGPNVKDAAVGDTALRDAAGSDRLVQVSVELKYQ